MQEGTFEEVNILGCRLSLELGCPVRYPAFNKNLFRCKHGWTVPLFKLRGSEDWAWVKEEHKIFIDKVKGV